MGSAQSSAGSYARIAPGDGGEPLVAAAAASQEQAEQRILAGTRVVRATTTAYKLPPSAKVFPGLDSEKDGFGRYKYIGWDKTPAVQQLLSIELNGPDSKKTFYSTGQVLPSEHELVTHEILIPSGEHLVGFFASEHKVSTGQMFYNAHLIIQADYHGAGAHRRMEPLCPQLLVPAPRHIPGKKIVYFPEEVRKHLDEFPNEPLQYELLDLRTLDTEMPAANASDILSSPSELLADPEAPLVRSQLDEQPSGSSISFVHGAQLGFAGPSRWRSAWRVFQQQGASFAFAVLTGAQPMWWLFTVLLSVVGYYSDVLLDLRTILFTFLDNGLWEYAILNGAGGAITVALTFKEGMRWHREQRRQIDFAIGPMMHSAWWAILLVTQLHVFYMALWCATYRAKHPFMAAAKASEAPEAAISAVIQTNYVMWVHERVPEIMEKIDQTAVDSLNWTALSALVSLLVLAYAVACRDKDDTEVDGLPGRLSSIGPTMAVLTLLRFCEISSRILSLQIFHLACRPYGGPVLAFGMLLLSTLVFIGCPVRPTDRILAALFAHPGQLLEAHGALPLSRSVIVHTFLIVSTGAVQLWQPILLEYLPRSMLTGSEVTMLWACVTSIWLGSFMILIAYRWSNPVVHPIIARSMQLVDEDAQFVVDSSALVLEASASESKDLYYLNLELLSQNLHVKVPTASVFGAIKAAKVPIWLDRNRLDAMLQMAEAQEEEGLTEETTNKVVAGILARSQDLRFCITDEKGVYDQKKLQALVQKYNLIFNQSSFKFKSLTAEGVLDHSLAQETIAKEVRCIVVDGGSYLAWPDRIFVHQMPKLEELQVRSLFHNSEDASGVERSKSFMSFMRQRVLHSNSILKKLDISDNASIPAEAWEELSTASAAGVSQSLQELRIASCFRNEEGLASTQGAVALMTWLVCLLQAPRSSLKVLDLSKNKGIPAEAWQLLAPAGGGAHCVVCCESLRELNLSLCFTIADESPYGDISGGPSDGDVFAMRWVMAQVAHGLQVLDISCNDQLSTQAWLELNIAGLQVDQQSLSQRTSTTRTPSPRLSLQEVSCTGCFCEFTPDPEASHLGSIQLMKLLVAARGQLQKLDLSSNEDVAAEAWEIIASASGSEAPSSTTAFSSLQELELSCCVMCGANRLSHPGMNAFVAFVGKCASSTAMKKLGISYNDALTSEAFDQLPDGCFSHIIQVKCDGTRALPHERLVAAADRQLQPSSSAAEDSNAAEESNADHAEASRTCCCCCGFGHEEQHQHPAGDSSNSYNAAAQQANQLHSILVNGHELTKDTAPATVLQVEKAVEASGPTLQVLWSHGWDNDTDYRSRVLEVDFPLTAVRHGVTLRTVVLAGQSGVRGDLAVFEQLPSLEHVDLRFTEVEGSISSFAASSSSLRHLHLGFCSKVGGDLAALGHMPRVEHLDLQKHDTKVPETQVHGDISCLSSCTALRQANFSSTEVRGDISSLVSCPALEVANFKFTQVHGDISCLSSCTALEEANFHFSQVQGDISCLSSCTALRHANFSQTQVHGDISWLSSCTALRQANFFLTRVSGDVGQLRSALPNLGRADFERTQVW